MKVTSFMIDHERLLKGIYVSRKDKIGRETVTTFDVRIKRPNIEPPVEVSAMHTLEHLIAVYLRESDRSDEIVYVGPMGCRTGMYIIFKGDLEPLDVLGPIKKAFEYAASFEGAVPAASPKECGNYLDHNLTLAKYESRIFLETLNNMKRENMVYPE